MTADTDKHYYRSERQPEKRKHTAIRLADEEIAELDEFAVRRGLVNKAGRPVRSAALRLRNTWARDNMPDDAGEDGAGT